MDPNTELTQMEEQLKQCNAQICVLQQRTDVIPGSTEEFIKDEELCKLEIHCELLENRIREILELRNYQSNCRHSFIIDLVDIDPDKSVTMEYCEHCLFCK